MAILSVNLNKIALLRNSRSDERPRLADFAMRALALYVVGVTVHPREDGRHITLADLDTIAQLPPIFGGARELNIEGDLRADLVAAVERIGPAQFTVVPVQPGEVTSSRGWRAGDDYQGLAEVCRRLCGRTRVSVFCDPNPRSCAMALEAGAQAIELFTGPYAASASSEAAHQLKLLAECANLLRSEGARVNGGHDLTLNNLPSLVHAARFDELSIGHQLTCDALDFGWEGAIQRYIDVISKPAGQEVL